MTDVKRVEKGIVAGLIRVVGFRKDSIAMTAMLTEVVMRKYMTVSWINLRPTADLAVCKLG